MDNDPLRLKIEQAFPGVLLEGRPFGKSDWPSPLWIASHALAGVAKLLKQDPSAPLTFLENLSVVELEQGLIASYFLSTRDFKKKAMIRFTLALDPLVPLVIPSVKQVWPMAKPMEQEISELFGIQFVLPNGQKVAHSGGLLAPDWAGYPLRKAYSFPSQFQGVTHARNGVSRG